MSAQNLATDSDSMAVRGLVFDALGRALRVIRVVRVDWSGDDDVEAIVGGMVVGRLQVEIENGGRIHALKLADGRRAWAVYWCRRLNAFRVLEVEP